MVNKADKNIENATALLAFCLICLGLLAGGSCNLRSIHTGGSSSSPPPPMTVYQPLAAYGHLQAQRRSRHLANYAELDQADSDEPPSKIKACQNDHYQRLANQIQHHVG